MGRIYSPYTGYKPARVLDPIEVYQRAMHRTPVWIEYSDGKVEPVPSTYMEAWRAWDREPTEYERNKEPWKGGGGLVEYFVEKRADDRK